MTNAHTRMSRITKINSRMVHPAMNVDRQFEGIMNQDNDLARAFEDIEDENF